jgi:hypothetical protein
MNIRGPATFGQEVGTPGECEVSASARVTNLEAYIDTTAVLNGPTQLRVPPEGAG